MFSTAIIIFREVLEISLIVGVLLVATRGLTGRRRMVTTGIVVGIIGSTLVAYFAGAISNFMEGVGQEVFNASVLFLAAILIAWTVVWMKQHSKQFTQHLKEVGRKVTEEELPLYMLAVVVGLAMLREGSEIVLFLFGILASGESLSIVTFGAFIGLLAGCAAGCAIYFGLIKVATRHLFSVTSWLLSFLAAGMVLQATGFLAAAGLIPEIVSPLWDTSKILPESGVIGKVLHALIGYTERPSAIQVISYLLTLGGIFMLLKLFNKTKQQEQPAKKQTPIVAIVFLFMALIGFQTEAFATKKVYSPMVEKGEIELEYKGEYDFDNVSGKGDKQKHKWGMGYGVTERWFTEVYLELEKDGPENGEVESIEWENKFQFFDQGRFWADTGLLIEYEAALDDKSAHKIEAKLLFEKPYTHSTHRLNLILERKIGAHADKDFEGGLAWSSRLRICEYFEPGFEYYANFEKLDEGKSYDEQNHQIGPVFYGQLNEHWKYELGYLFGISDASTDGVLKWIVEFEF